MSRNEKWRLAGYGAGGILCGITISLIANIVLFLDAPTWIFARAIIAAVVVPPLVVTPLCIYFALRMRRLNKRNLELSAFARIDSLTQIQNRGSFADSVSEKLEEMRGRPVTRGALLVLDADWFKKINDRWGHATGDRALAMIADRMRTVVHKDDVIGRLGGEEFGIFLNGSGPTGSRNVAERLRTLVAAIDLRSDENESIRLSISIGAVHFCEVFSFATLYKLADRKLYEAKAKGRNRVEFEEMLVGANAEMAA